VTYGEPAQIGLCWPVAGPVEAVQAQAAASTLARVATRVMPS